MDLQLLSQCGSTQNCLSRSVPEIHSHVAGTLNKQASNQLPGNGWERKGGRRIERQAFEWDIETMLLVLRSRHALGW